MSTQTQEIFKLPIGPVSGSTPFGYYDSDLSFQFDAPKFCNLSARKLGYPVIDIELPSGSMFAAFEEGITEYSYFINNNNAQNNFLDLKGKPLDEDVTGKNVTSNFLTYVISLSDQYGTEADAGGNIEFHLGKIFTSKSVQTYDLKELFENDILNGEKIEIRKVYHNRKPAAMRYYDPSVGVRSFMESLPYNTQMGYNFLMHPIYDDLLRLQQIEFNDTVRKSPYSFRLINNTLRLHPVPKESFPVYFEYIKKKDKISGGDVVSGSEDTVSDISNIPYSNLIYSKINAVGKRWIHNFGFAIVQEMLGRVRSKYQSIPSPSGDITLDGPELIQNGQSEQEKLREQLKEILGKMTTTAMLNEKKEQSEIISDELSKIPMAFYIR